jgi:uncharacterized protein YfkK (UPF0435 family)
MRDKIEIHLFELVKKYDPYLAALYLESGLKGLQDMDKSLKFPDYIKIPLLGIWNDCCFRIGFHFPLFFLLSYQISFFRTSVKYYKSDLRFIPAYVPAINAITLIKTWGQFADGIVGPGSKLSADYTCIKISKEKEAADLSSMNFILRHNSSWEKEYNENVILLINKYFKYLYWNIPRTNQIKRDTFFYHDYEKIHSTYHITKTILIIDSIKESENIDLGYKQLKLKRISIRCLANTNNIYYFKEFDCYILDEIINKFESKGCIIVNALINTIKIDRMEYNILTGIIDFIKNHQDLIKSIIGLIAVERFYLGGQPQIGKLQEFEKEVFKLVKYVDNFIGYFRTQSYGIYYDKALLELQPILLNDNNNNIYFFHPVFLGLLESMKRIDLLQKKTSLIDLMNLIRYERLEARLSNESDNLQRIGISKQSILNCIDAIKDGLAYSRIIRK